MNNLTGIDGRSSERGAISIKTLLMLVLVAVAAFVAIKIVPTYIEQQKVLHDVGEVARIAAVRGWKEDRINQDIKRIKNDYNLPDNGINFVSASSERGVQIAVSYQRNIDLIVTTYLWKVSQTIVGKDI